MIKTVQLKISGMHCPNCPRKVERVLSRIEGVSKVEVMDEKEIGIVTFDPTKTDITQFTYKISKMGFVAKEYNEITK